MIFASALLETMASIYMRFAASFNRQANNSQHSSTDHPFSSIRIQLSAAFAIVQVAGLGLRRSSEGS